MRIAYLDCFSGISGDMFVAAFLDAGVSLDDLRGLLECLPADGWSVATEKTRRGPLAATRFVVSANEAKERRLAEILEIIDRSSLPATVKDNSKKVFSELARAEARVHGVGPDDVHFHEVGALDSIVDIVGAASCLHLLGVERLYASTLSVGKGQISSRHGTLPLPAPAAAELLLGKSVRVLDIDAELVTPTGAAIVSALATQGEIPGPLRMERVGYGAGANESPTLPNVLRVLIGHLETSGLETGLVEVLETTIDDMNPQVYGFLQERLFQMGALDVFLTPVQMKKGRPGTLLTALCEPGGSSRLADEILAQTTTLGLRVSTQRRVELKRSVGEVVTPYGKVRVKFPEAFPDRVSPEYDDLTTAAKKHSVPIMTVYDAARAAWLRKSPAEREKQGLR